MRDVKAQLTRCPAHPAPGEGDSAPVAVNNTFKGQLDLERHGGHTPAGVITRILQRILALTAAIWHNDHTRTRVDACRAAMTVQAITVLPDPGGATSTASQRKS